MKQKLLLASILFSIFVLCSCSSKSENQDKANNSTDNYPSSNTNDNNENGTSENNYTVNAEDVEETNDETNEKSNDDDETHEKFSGCKFEDGTYSATVNYSNPETGYSATYTLNVEVQDCQIVQINFPNDGYLDEDHISATDLDEDGSATIDGEDGKTYEIQIDD